MSNLLKNNAYHILGLDTSASQKDIVKRSKDLIKLVQIDDIPKYDFDIDIFQNFRTENNIKEAVQKLTSPKKQIKDYFFWFHISDEIDEQAVGILRKNDINGAILVWENHANGDSPKALFYKKNLAVLYCLLLFKKDNEHYLKSSLKIWNEVVSSSKFWASFNRVFKLNDELNTSQEVIDDFQKNCASYISDLYTELAEAHKENKYVAEFSSIFNSKGTKTSKVLLEPIFNELISSIEELEAMKVSDDGMLDKQEAVIIKKHISIIQDGCNKLIELGLYDDSQSKIIRDRAAAAIRSIVLDIHNNLDDMPKAEQLLKIAIQFVGTPGMENKLKQDLDQFEKNKKFLNTIAPIMTLMNEKKFEEAITLIEQKKAESKDPEFKLAMDSKKKEAVTMYAVVEFLDAKKLFDSGKYDEASPRLQKSASIVYDNIEIFDVDKSVIDSWLETIKNNVKILTSENADQVDEVHNNMLKKLDEVFDERWEQMAMKILINSYYYVGLGEIIKKNKTSNVVSTIIRWAVTIGIIWLIGAIFG